MLAHIFSLKAIKKMIDIKLPYHRAFRKNAFVNFEGMKEVPESPNIYKFEQFVFDAFSFFDNILFTPNIELEITPSKPQPGYDQAPIVIAFENGVLNEGLLKPPCCIF